MSTTTKKSVGRPVKEINTEMVQKLAQIHCTDEEIASILGIGIETFKRRKKDPEFADMLVAARSRGKASLRRIQWQLAEKGNAAMAIFLGKNLLGQRDKFEDTAVENNLPLPWKD